MKDEQKEETGEIRQIDRFGSNQGKIIKRCWAGAHENGLYHTITAAMIEKLYIYIQSTRNPPHNSPTTPRTPRSCSSPAPSPSSPQTKSSLTHPPNPALFFSPPPPPPNSKRTRESNARKIPDSGEDGESKPRKGTVCSFKKPKKRKKKGGGGGRSKQASKQASKQNLARTLPKKKMRTWKHESMKRRRVELNNLPSFPPRVYVCMYLIYVCMYACIYIGIYIIDQHTNTSTQNPKTSKPHHITNTNTPPHQTNTPIHQTNTSTHQHTNTPTHQRKKSDRITTYFLQYYSI